MDAVSYTHLAKADWLVRSVDVLSARYSYSTMGLHSPYSELGADVPGFPVGYFSNTHLGLSLIHI